FLHLSDGGASNFFARVYVTPPSVGSTSFTLGLSYTSTSATVGVVPWTSTLTYGTAYNVVVKYDPVGKTATMWVNPSAESDPSVSQTGRKTPFYVSVLIICVGCST